MWYIEFANRVSTRSDSLSRVQYIMSLGQPCVDLVFYRLTFEDDNFDPTKFGIQPLSVVAVVCGGKLTFGVWADTSASSFLLLPLREGSG